MIITTKGVGSTRRTDIGDMVVTDINVIQYRNAGKLFVRYHYDEMLDKLAKDMRDNIHKGYDNVAVVEGPEGSGKSNYAYQLCCSIDPEFNLTKQYVYSFDDLRDKLREGGDQGSVLWLDESSNVANNRDWQSRENKDMVSLLEMMRSRGWTLIMCIPRHERLDVYIREYRIRYLIKCEPMTFRDGGHKDRGYFEARKRDPYGVMRLVGYGSYDKIPDGPKAIYEQLKLESQTKKIAEVVNTEKPGMGYKRKYEEERIRIQNVMLTLYEAGRGTEDLMRLFGINAPSTLYNNIRRARIRRDNEREEAAAK